jgi:hypothetical protein
MQEKKRSDECAACVATVHGAYHSAGVVVDTGRRTAESVMYSYARDTDVAVPESVQHELANSDNP